MSYLWYSITCREETILRNRICGSVGTGRRARLRILWALRSCGFKSHLPHKKPLIFKGFFFWQNRRRRLFFDAKSVIQMSKYLIWMIFLKKRGIWDFVQNIINKRYFVSLWSLWRTCLWIFEKTWNRENLSFSVPMLHIAAIHGAGSG